MLAIEVRFLTGRYTATAFDDRARTEWPPHPARFFSAMVATHFESDVKNEQELRVLSAVASLEVPHITASDASERECTRVFVPVNDTTVVGDLDDEWHALDAARSSLEAAQKKGGKAVADAEKKMAGAQARITKALAAVSVGQEGKEGPWRAVSLLPDQRLRQPRTFPSVTPDDPRVVYAWPNAALSPEEVKTLDSLLARLVRLGHSSSLVTARVCEGSGPATWAPDDTGEIRSADDETVLRTVSSDQVESLQALFDRQGLEPGRVMPARFTRYVRVRPEERVLTPTSAFGQGWIVLQRASGPRLPSTRGVELARMVRRAILSSYGEGAPEVLSGHRVLDEPSQRPHLAIVPLPWVGHPNADGTILGVALVLPTSASLEDRRALLRAVNTWRRYGARIDDELRMPVHLGRAGRLDLVVPQEEVAQTTLHPRSWCQRSARWLSVTPVALDRNPGDLRANDPAKQAEGFAEAEAIIAKSCEHIGLPRPKQVTVLPAAPVAGAHKARMFPPYRAGHQRVLVHASVVFDVPVDGPVLLGAGRYFGLGLFRPTRDHG